MAKANHFSSTPIADSETLMTQIVLPPDTNALGTVFGGVVASWIDIAAAITASRYTKKTVVTASIDALHFIAPIKLGYIVYVRATVNYVSKTSLEIGVRVESENPLTGKQQFNVRAYVTMVALNRKGKPTPIPRLLPKTVEQKRRFKEAQIRRQKRIELAQILRNSAVYGE